jgi:hypothetical protein
MITTDWNNDLEDEQLIPESMREDDDTERSEDEEQSHVYSPFSPFYNETLNKD